MIKQLENQLRNVRNATKENSPLIHCITNPISIHGCANMILAVGARPMMAEHPLEVEDITRTAGALMLNLGNITDARMESMRRSVRVAMECGIPILLDLVGVTCSRIRMELARELIGFGQIQILKGNISELLAIAGQSFHGTGIDAGKEDAMTDENEEERRKKKDLPDVFTTDRQCASGYRSQRSAGRSGTVSDTGKWYHKAVRDHRYRMHGWSAYCRLSGTKRSVYRSRAWHFCHGNRRRTGGTVFERPRKLPDRTAGRSGRDAPGSTGRETSDPRDRSVTYVNSKFKRMGAKKSLLA